MSTEHLYDVRIYTEEEGIRLVQHMRGRAILSTLNLLQEPINQGMPVLLKDSFTGDRLLVDQTYLKMLRGGFFGVYNEALSSGLTKEELR